MSEFDNFYWKHNDCLNKDTSLAHSFGEKVWNHQQAIIDDLIYKAKLRESDHQALLVKYQATKKCWEDIGKECEGLKAQLNNMEACYIKKKEEVEDQQKRVDGALSFYNIAKSDVNIGMMQMAIYLKGNKDE